MMQFMMLLHISMIILTEICVLHNFTHSFQRSIKERDGDFSIDFGVKGGEIDKKSRAPQKV